MKKIFTLLVITVFGLTTNAQIIITIAGNHSQGFGGDSGPALAAELNNPQAVAVDAIGNLYIADFNNNRIRKVNPSGIITTVAGNGILGFSGDGGQAMSAKLGNPSGVACDAAGNLYIADYNNGRIRKVSPSGIITTVAGNGTLSFSGDGGSATAAGLWAIAVAVDGAGNIYIADNGDQRIRKVNTSGIISTIAGNGTNGFSGDGGTATAAALSDPTGVAVDATGNVYIADYNNLRIRMINTSGVINTVAGNGVYSSSGDGGPATAAGLESASSITLDVSGNLYISDLNASVIRKVNTSGTINTIAGNGLHSYTGDGGQAVSASFSNLYGIACDIKGNLFVADQNNHVIREIGNCIPIVPSICMVEVDSFSLNNIIYWDKTPYTADTFYIYRDTANYNYALIGKVPNDSLSMFVDTVRTLYSANGDPNASSWRYKIAYRDTCGGVGKMSPMSPWHQTVFMITNGTGTFIWTQYQIEGQNTPVNQLSSYYFEVDSFTNGYYHVVQTLSASSTLYHDTHYANYPNPTWRSTAMGFNCNPTLRLAEGNNNTFAVRQKSHSNSARQNNITGLKEVRGNNGQVMVYPNPASNSLNINCASINNKTIITMYDASGRVILQHACTSGSQTQTIDLQSIQSGMYFIEVGGTRKIITVSK